MTAHKGHGQTWWGAQWLNSLSQIDYDNRLPRGRSYASKDAVERIEIQHGSIVWMITARLTTQNERCANEERI